MSADHDRRSLLHSPSSDTESDVEIPAEREWGRGRRSFNQTGSFNVNGHLPVYSAPSDTDADLPESNQRRGPTSASYGPRRQRSITQSYTDSDGEVQRESSKDRKRSSLHYNDQRPASRISPDIKTDFDLDEMPPADASREVQKSSISYGGRRSSHRSPVSEVEPDLEAQWERSRDTGRGSLNHSGSRRMSGYGSPVPDVHYDPDFDTRDRGQDFERERERFERTGHDPVLQRRPSIAAQMSERVPPEWALLLLGCFLGLASGLSVVAFNHGVHFIHNMAWAGTPHEGAAWLRLQKLSDTWHRIMLIPVVGGVVVGMMHAIVGVIEQVRASRPHRRGKIDWLAGARPAIKAAQAMVTLGTGSSLGPEGPSVDIGKAWAHGLAEVMKNSRERRIALVAAGAAAGISSGFNAPVSGCFFAIETVLRPQHAENSPPLTTAMIILASVISSTVSQMFFGESPAFSVPTYELRSAAELPLYLLLGGVCGVVSVLFTRLTARFTRMFEFLIERIGIPSTVTPAIGGVCVGLIALRYPGVLYWGFTNVDEILHSGKTATAPGSSLLTQLICAKVVATALCKGSGLVGGVYAPSLFIGSAVGSVYGTMAGKAINAVMPGHDTVAHPQAYALVGMAALLAAVCSVPLTSVLLLFELTKDYHILLPLMGGIGVAIWVAAVANKKPAQQNTALSVGGARSGLYNQMMSMEGPRAQVGLNNMQVWRRKDEGTEVELCTLDECSDPFAISDDELWDDVKVSQAMSKKYVKVQAIATVKETIGAVLLAQQHCALVVDENDLLEGVMTFSDLEREVLRAAEAFVAGDPTVLEVDKMLVAAFCSGKGENQGEETDLVVCFPDMSLRMAKDLMESHGFRQLPVVTRGGQRWQDHGRQLIGLLDCDAIPHCIREEASKRVAALIAKSAEDDDAPLLDGH